MVDIFNGVSVDVENPVMSPLVGYQTIDTEVLVVPIAGPPGTAGEGVTGPTSFTSAGAVSGHRLVVPTGTSQVEYADHDDLTDVTKPVWLTIAASGAGEPVNMVFFGQVVEPSWSWTPNSRLYVGVTGLITETPPTTGYLRQIGYAYDSTTIWFDPSSPVVL